MKNKNLMSLIGSKSFFGLSVLMFVAFMSFTNSVNAQYVSNPVAIEILKQETLSVGNFKQAGSPASAKFTSNVSPIDYAKSFRVAYVKELYDLVVLYGNVALAIDVNNANWTQKLSNSAARSASAPVLKAYVINLLKA